MLELFSRRPDVIVVPDGVHLTPIPISEELSSLSAILLDDEYYQFILEGKRKVEGLSVLSATHLIPLKVQAYINLSLENGSGGDVDERDIRKHRNDVIRLYRLLSPHSRVFLSPSIYQSMLLFFKKIRETSIDLKSLGIRDADLNDVIAALGQIYCESNRNLMELSIL
jgi:hypothetical protein